MYYDIRLLGCYGSEWDIFQFLKRRKYITQFEIATENMPYLHYQIWIQTQKALFQIRKMIANMPYKYKVRGKNNSHVANIKYGLEAFQKYIRKQGNPVINADYDIDLNIQDLSFKD